MMARRNKDSASAASLVPEQLTLPNLRAPDDESRREAMRLFIEDLRKISGVL
jgi:hypothetical protein